MARNGTSRSHEWRQLNKIFEAAIELPTNERDAFLDKSCGKDESLRAQAMRLLDAAGKVNGNNFLTGDAFQVGARVIAEGAARKDVSGRRIGHFTIVSEIARGGMGAVYLAERDDF